jgi:hypothetical protein
MIDIDQEQAITLREAARLYGSSRGGRPTHASTIVRHIVKGTKIPGGEVVRLEGGKIGKKWITTRQAVQRYVDTLTRVALAETETAEATTATVSKRRQQELARVDRDLDAAGIVSHPTPARRGRKAQPNTVKS